MIDAASCLKNRKRSKDFFDLTLIVEQKEFGEWEFPDAKARASASSGGRLTNTITAHGLGSCFKEFQEAPNLDFRRSAPFF